jgi:aminopeptidase N
MRFKIKYFYFFIIPFLGVSCSKQNNQIDESQSISIIADSDNSPIIYSNKKIYQSSRKLTSDLIHTKLEVKFDWNKCWLIGKATLTLQPHYYATDSLELDAQSMEIKSLLVHNTPLTYTYKNDKLRIKLDRLYTKNEKYTIVIEYISKPNERVSEGNESIMSDKGLYFINPKGEDKTVMPQIWTQGETQANSVWFPTIDAPNIKTSQEIHITVETKYKTLSNGKLVSSISNADGTRTDYWKQDLPHAPYLFMLAVGEFKIVNDTWIRKDGSKLDLHYFVEPEWEDAAKSIFGETPAMISYFSNLTGIEFPWDKYDQIVVRDYVSGAMENTGAVVFGDYVYKTQRELLDENDQSVIAHELFHHWFGDLVTCESWSNLPLNESFANYAQYLWDDFRYGKDQADFGNEEEVIEYFSNFENGENHDLIWYSYEKSGDMFDKHSYNKGGRILHMLRAYLGDDAFFDGLKYYLKTNAYKTVEADHLRLAFEEVSGQDLHWFFNQWFFNAGIPDLRLEYYTSQANKELVVTVTQQQNLETTPLYRLPLEVAVYDEAGEHFYKVEIDEIENKLVFPIVGKLKAFVFDNQQVLLARITDEKPSDLFINQYYLNKRYNSRKDAISFGTVEDSPESEQLILDALKDPFWKIREVAIEKAVFLKDLQKYKGKVIIQELATNDLNSSVREAAIHYLQEELDKTSLEKLLVLIIENEKSYKVLGVALEALNSINTSLAIQAIKPLEKDDSPKIQLVFAKMYSSESNPNHIPFFLNLFKQNKIKGYDALSLLNTFTIYISKLSIDSQLIALDVYKFQNEKGNYYAKMYLPQNVEYLIQSIDANNTSQEKLIREKTDNFLKELRNFYELINNNQK